MLYVRILGSSWRFYIARRRQLIECQGETYERIVKADITDEQWRRVTETQRGVHDNFRKQVRHTR
jgi:hypothetical protein